MEEMWDRGMIGRSGVEFVRNQEMRGWDLG